MLNVHNAHFVDLSGIMKKSKRRGVIKEGSSLELSLFALVERRGEGQVKRTERRTQ